MDRFNKKRNKKCTYKRGLTDYSQCSILLQFTTEYVVVFSVGKCGIWVNMIVCESTNVWYMRGKIKCEK